VYLEFTEEQQDFRSSVRRLVADRAPMQRVRDIAESDGHDEDLWRRLTLDLGVAGLHVPEEYGGSGASLEETAVVVEVLGGSLAPVPVLTSAVATEAVLRLASDDQRKRLLPELALGERVAVLAVAGARDVATVASGVRARGDRREVVLDGEVAYALQAAAADVLLIPAVDETGEVAVYVVDSRASGLDITPLPAFDRTRPVSALRLRAVRGERLGDGSSDASAQLDRIVDVARALLAIELVGAGDACLALAVEHATNRVQFNRPIGSFQAVKHICAEMAIELDAARAAAMFAVMTAATTDDAASAQLAIAAPVAKAQAADACLRCAESTIQVHGGMGFTWEHDAHLYFRRARSAAALFGSSAQHRALLAERVGFGASAG
jgi:alkylation response protein AidB-like acyl-CoA dehydrogenase